MTRCFSRSDLCVRSFIGGGAALAESDQEGPDVGPCLTGASGHFLKGGVLARSDAQGLRQVVGDIRWRQHLRGVQ